MTAADPTRRDATRSGRRWVPRTLRGRLAVSALLAAALAVVLLTIAFDLLLAHQLDGEVRTVLRSRATAATAAVHVRSDGSLEVTDGVDALLDTGVWVYQGRTALARPPGSPQLQRGADALAGSSNRFVRRDDEERATAYLSTAVQAAGRQVGTVVTAVSLDPYRSSFRKAVTATALLGVLLVGLVYLLARAVAGRALTPVAVMTRQAGAWSTGKDADQRFGQAARPGELDELAQTLDRMLDRLAAVLRREQQLTAEISHELRTPLAGIVAEVELFQVRPRTTPEAEAAMVAVGQSARRLERILDTLLSAARTSPDGSARGRCDAREVVEELAQATGAGGVPTEVSGVDGPAWAGLEADVLERLLVPLLDNARRYARAHVVLDVREHPDAVEIAVVDDGPGVSGPDVEMVFEPGLRLRPDDAHPGAGLGLPLARRLATAVGAELTCRPGPGGRFVVRLPRG